MLQTVTFKMRNLIAVLTLILIAGSAAMAQAPSTPRNLRAMADQGVEGVVLSWNMERNSDNPTGFYIYMAEDETEDFDDFSLFQDIVVSDDNENLINQGGYWAAFLEMELEDDQELTFYIIAYNDDGESDPSNFAKLRNQNNYPRAFLYFTNEINEEDMYATINEEWTFDADASVVDEDSTVYTDGITYSILQSNIEIDINSETGEVSFTPTESGYVHFFIEAVWDEDDRVRSHLQISVFVRTCEIPAVISGTVYDEDGDPVNNEMIHVMNADGNNQGNDRYYMAWIEDGEFSVEVDAGSYILFIEGRNYITEFYEDAATPEDATIIEVDCEDEVNVEMTVLRNQNNYPRAFLYFTNEINEEDMYATINEEWTFDADASVVDEDSTVYTDGITYSILESNIEIDINSETGEVSFTPTESGNIHFVIEAVWDEDDRVRSHLLMSVFVRTCEIPAVISGTVYDEDGDPVNNEMIHVMNADGNNQGNDRYYMAWIEDGEFSVEVDAGSYILLFEGRNYITEFYEDAATPEDATIIEVDCEDEVSVEMTVTSLDDLDYYTVTGNVSYYDGDAIEGALVEFRAIDSNRWQSIFNAITDENGDYEIEVPDIYTYIAVAYNIELVYGGGRDSMFCKHPLYYEQTYDPREATEIDITGDLDGIDFVFDNEDYEFNNEISGIVQNEQEETIENCYIVAFNTDTDNFFYRKTFPSQTNTNGEFLLEDLVPGNYVLLAFPGMPDYAPGFYVEDDIITWTWEEATEIEIDEDETISDIVITLPLMEDMGGICELRGRIRQRGGQIKGGDSPLSGEVLDGASIYLATYDGSPVKYTSTNDQGEFEFVNVKEGEYILKVDKIGYENYQVPVELSYGESKDMDEIALIEDGTSSVDDNNTANASIYPNPANSIFNITYEAAANISRITISNAAGMQVFSSEENTMQGFNTFNYDVQNLTNGTYFIKVQSGSNVSVIPLVVIH